MSFESQNILHQHLRNEGFYLPGTDGSVAPLDLRQEAVPRHRFKELIELNAPVVEQLSDSPGTVATLTKTQAKQKVSNAIKLERNTAVNNALRQLDRLVMIYKRRMRKNEEISQALVRFMARRLATIYRNYQEGDATIHRDWGQYRVDKFADKLTFSRLARSDGRPVYRLILDHADADFASLQVETLSNKARKYESVFKF